MARFAGCPARTRPRAGAAALAVVAFGGSLAACSSGGGHSVTTRTTASAAGSPAPPAASNFSVPAAVEAPDVTLVDVEHGVAVVGVASVGGGSQEAQPSTLWLSSDLMHWQDVTPPAAREPLEGDLYPMFDAASFLSPTTGWVTTWNAGNLAVLIYRTSDGGRTWSAVAGGGHGDHAGDAEWIQLVTPSLAFAENIEATAPNMALQVSTDGGASWRTSYTGPPPAASAKLLSGPFEMPMRFASADRGFAATGIPAAELNAAGDFFTTDDGGASWRRQTPPLAAPANCSPPAGPGGQCLFTLPMVVDTTHAVLANEVVSGTQAGIGFDTSADSGASWQLAGRVDVQLLPVPANGYPKPVALVATPTDHDWWIASSTAAGVSTRVSTDAGRHWSVFASAETLGVPADLQALDGRRALLTTDVTTSNGTTTALYATADAGQHWQRLFAR